MERMDERKRGIKGRISMRKERYVTIVTSKTIKNVLLMKSIF
jgi:hypothetical protein